MKDEPSSIFDRTKALSRRSFGSSSGSRRNSYAKKQSVDRDLVQVVKIWEELCEVEGAAWVPSIKKADRSLETTNLTETELRITLQKDNANAVTELEVLGPLVDAPLSSALGNFLTKFATLSVLRLPDCKLRAESIVLLGYFMRQSQTIKDVCLDLNPVSGEDYSPLLKDNPILLYLSLRMCQITEKGARLLAKEVENHQSLTVLNLNTNLINCQGAKYFAQALRWNKRLFVLSLAGNQIGNEGAKQLCSILMRFTLNEEDLALRQERINQRAQQVYQLVREQEEGLASKRYSAKKSSGSIIENSKKKSSSPKVKTFSSKRAVRKLSSTSIKLRKEKKGESTQPKASASAQTPTKMVSSSISMPYGRTSVQAQGRIGSSSSTQPKVISSSQSPVRPGERDASVVSSTLKGTEEECKISDTESLTDFSQFHDELEEEYDGSDYERAHELDTLISLSEQISVNLGLDKHPAFSSVSRNAYLPGEIKLQSSGNKILGYLNLAYNLIEEDGLKVILKVLKYQSDTGFKEKNRGIRKIFLKGNKFNEACYAMREINLYFPESQLSLGSMSNFFTDLNLYSDGHADV